MSSLRPIERLVLDVLLAGEDPALAILRAQAASVEVLAREHTVVGEYVNLKPAADCPRVEPQNIILSDIDLKVEDVEIGVTTLLYVEDGCLSCIEFATYTGEWPTEPVVLNCKYLREEETVPNTYSLIPVSERDPAALARALRGRSSSVALSTPRDTP